MNNLANQFQQHQNGNSSTIVSIPLIQQAIDSNNLASSNNINSNVNNKNATFIQITTPNSTSNVPIQIETNSAAHVKIPNSIKINQLPLNLSSSSIVLAPNNNNSSNLNNSTNPSNTITNSYGGFAYCSNCKEYGVKAAFYGKSKLYCSVACQNGIKKQQQNQGVKRTIDALNSPNNSPTTNTSVPNQQHLNITTTPTNTNTNQIPTLIPINSPLIQSNLTINSTTPTIINRLNENTIIINESNNPKVAELLAANNVKINFKTSNEYSSNINKQQSETPKSTIQTNDLNLLNFNRSNSIPNSSNKSNLNNLSSNSLSSSISSTIDSVLNSLEANSSSNPPPPKRQRNNSIQSNSSSNESSTLTKTNLVTATPNNQFVRQKSSPTNTTNKSPTSSSISPTIASIKSVTTTPTATFIPQFSWTHYIEKDNCHGAPVNLFKHVPLCDFWRKLSKNIHVEVPNLDPPDLQSITYMEPICKSNIDSGKFYWFASIIHYEGYYAKLRYVGYDDDSSQDFWMHMCDEEMHPIGHAAENDIPLVPPNKLADKQNDWKNYLLDKMNGFNTLPKFFHVLVKKSLKSRFEKGMVLELIDKKKLSRMRVARIIENIGGRLRMKYENSDCFEDFWCHEKSELIHPVGWSMNVGHDIYADEDYKKNSVKKYQENSYNKNECSKDMFKKVRDVNKSSILEFEVNMKLEAIDPLNLSSISAATVGKVLKNNYLMIKIDGYPSQEGEMFCFHQSSSSIFPAGFCEKNSLELLPPCDYKKSEKFDWTTYLEETNSEFAPIELFYDDSSHTNPFKVGMKLESVDLMEPKMICVATVVAVVNRLIKLNFDGWDQEYDQWIDFESCDIYPIGWCQLFNYSLQPPLNKNSDCDFAKKKGKRTYNKKK